LALWFDNALITSGGRQRASIVWMCVRESGPRSPCNFEIQLGIYPVDCEFDLCLISRLANGGF